MIPPLFFFVFSGAANIIRVIPGKHFRVLIVPIKINMNSHLHFSFEQFVAAGPTYWDAAL